MAAVALLVVLPLFGGFAARADSGIESWSAFQNAVNSAASGDTIVLTEDLTAGEADSALIIPAGKRLTLDLNGHTLDRNLNEGVFTGSAIYVSTSAILTIRDSGATQGAVTGGYSDTGGGVSNYGTLILEGGRITGNIVWDAGGGIANYGTAILTGGSVTGNTALRGGGVYNEAKARLTVNDGVLYGNAAPENRDIFNEGTLTSLGAQPGGARVEEIPVLRAYMTELSVLPAAALLLVLALVVWLDAYLSRERKRVMAIIIALVFSLMLQNYVEYRLSLVSGTNALRLPSSVFGYAVRPAILATFLYIVKPGRRCALAWVLIGINAAVYLTAFFSPIALSFSENGHWRPGPLNDTSMYISAALFAWLFLLTIRQFHPRARKESWIPICVTALLAGAVVMDYNVIFDEQPLAFLTIAIVVSCIAYYVWLHLQFVREHEEALRAGQRIQLMMSQIQPHFLFNSLEVIRRIYRKEPEKADDALLKFERYLRGNMDSMAREEPIPFEMELKHTQTYLALEQLRFPDELHIAYDLRCTDFLLPSLTLQPLVENAVHHGVRGKKIGEGTVTIATREYENRYEVVVTDDGDGFDPTAVPREDQSHIGLNNVRERLRYAGDELRIGAGPEGGTEAVIIIPRKEQRGGVAP